MSNLVENDPLQSGALDFGQAVLEGLSLPDKSLPSWLLFDNHGNDLFRKITELPDYPPSVCERSLMSRHAEEIAQLLPASGGRIIELGAAEGKKVQSVLNHRNKTMSPTEYVPIDIMEAAVSGLVNSFSHMYKGTTLRVSGLIADFFKGMAHVVEQSKDRNLVLFLGATLGNRSFEEMKQFLKRVRQSIHKGDYLIIGFDMMKHPKLLYSAYNDSMGCFEAFNLYMLERINQELDADFNQDYFVQQAQYNPATRSVESYLFSTREQKVTVKALGKSFHFQSWEKVRTERSYKFTREEIETLAREGGFETLVQWEEPEYLYLMPVWQAK